MYCLRCDKISEIGELCCPKPIKLTAIGAIELAMKLLEFAGWQYKEQADLKLKEGKNE